MSEITFAKSFLATLDKKPIKLPADHVSDPRKYPNQSPFILPRKTHPFPRKSPASKPQPSNSLSATLKPMRAGTVEPVTLSDLTLDTTIYEIKTQYASKTGLQQDKIKLLLNKKPTADLKTLKELGINEDVEFSVMIMGGGGSGTTPRAESPAVTEKERAPTPAVSAPEDKSGAPESEKANLEAEKTTSSGDTAQEILKTEEFWSDLKGFLSQRLRDEQEGEKLSAVFEEAWGRGGGSRVP